MEEEPFYMQERQIIKAIQGKYQIPFRVEAFKWNAFVA